MNLQEMRTLVQQELDHISAGSEPQNMVRMIYWTRRMNSLGKKAVGPKEARSVLQACIEDARKSYPGHQFRYDRVFFEGSSAAEGYYECKITPKQPEEDRKAVRRLGHQLLKLRNYEAEKRVGPIAFEGVPLDRFPETLLDLINGKASRPAHVRFAKSDYSPDDLTDLLRAYFPRRLVKDVTIDGKSIFDGAKG
jgi:hypothetical protein